MSTKPNAGQDQIDRLVLARQAVLHREHPPLMYALIDKGCCTARSLSRASCTTSSRTWHRRDAGIHG